MHAANTGDTKIRQFIDDAIAVASAPVSKATYPRVVAWRTQYSSSPGRGFVFAVRLQGNDFYSAIPVPPVRQRFRPPGPYRPAGSRHGR